MSPGQIARRLLGPRAFRLVGRAYRRVFVDLRKVVESFPPLPEGAEVLDVGGGDGEVVNLLLARFPSVRVTMIDLGENIGTALDSGYRDRVRVLPKTSVEAYAQQGGRVPDVLILSDVLHHIPIDARPRFFEDLASLVRGRAVTLIVKDVAPEGVRSRCAYLADRYISGDRNVAFLSPAELEASVRRAFPAATAAETDLVRRDFPNYALVFAIPA